MTQQYSSFFVDEGVTRVELEKGEWVEVKNEMSIGDWEQYEGSMLQIIAEEESANTGNRALRRRNQRQQNNAQTIKMSAGILELLYINIKGWSFEVVPINKKNISKLKERFASKILDAIQEQNPDNPLAQMSSATDPTPTT